MQENLSFEEALAKLEATVQALEAGNLPLEEATRLFEEGMRLGQLCNQMLNATELKVTQLKEAYLNQSGQPAEDEQPAES
ncbi:MAG: exodeoxyribonuclease VII small subunit [Dehalococcoidia bacterium]